LSYRFYPARYSKELGSIFALGDICNLILDSDADCCILEEPEHLNWMRPTDAHIPLWTDKFKYVVGIIHTNYKAYAQAHVSGFISAPFIGSLSSLMTRVHCHRIIKLSSCLQSFAPEKEIVSNTHGIRSEFLTKEDMDRQTMDGNYYSPIYFLGKLLWAKGLDKLLQLQYAYRRVTGEFFKIDIYGSGPDEIEIKRTFCGSQEELVKSSESEESYAQENILLREKIVRSIDSFMSDLPSLRHDWKRAPIPCEFHGRVDHVELKGRHKIFVNPSITEVLCTTTAEVRKKEAILDKRHEDYLF
jgi:digalactosyldiacylglycerol synthase